MHKNQPDFGCSGLAMEHLEQLECANGDFVFHGSECFHQLKNVYLKLRTACGTRGWRIVCSRVACMRHLVLDIFGADTFWRVDHGSFAPLCQRKSGLDVVD